MFRLNDIRMPSVIGKEAQSVVLSNVKYQVTKFQAIRLMLWYSYSKGAGFGSRLEHCLTWLFVHLFSSSVNLS